MEISKSSKRVIVCLVFAVIIVASALLISNNMSKQKEYQRVADEAINYFNSGNYVRSLEIKNSLEDEKYLGDYSRKITLMGNLVNYLRTEGKELSAVFYFLGNYTAFESEGLVEVVYADIIDAAQKFAGTNANFRNNVSYYANREYEQWSFHKPEDEKMSELLEPTLTENRNLLFEIANKIDSAIDYDLAKEDYKIRIEEYKKELEEKEKEQYDRNNPVQMSQDDYTAYRNGDYWYCEGTIHNISNSTRYFVKIKVTYMDKDKTVLTSDWTYAVGSEGIRGGENQQFEIMTKVRGDVNYYQAEIIEWALNEQIHKIDKAPL